MTIDHVWPPQHARALELSNLQNSGLLSDNDIRRRLELPDGSPFRLRIDPFAEMTPGKLSHGLTSNGYDFRLGRKFRIVDKYAQTIIDPLDLDEYAYSYEYEVGSLVLQPHSFALATTLERFRIPEDVSALVLLKSTWNRCSINMSVGDLEPGWEGNVTIEIANTGDLPVRVHAERGFGQIKFFSTVTPCGTPYNKKPGARYQGQSGITLPK